MGAALRGAADHLVDGPKTAHGVYDSAGAWSPDGTQIAFESDVDGDMDLSAREMCSAAGATTRTPWSVLLLASVVRPTLSSRALIGRTVVNATRDGEGMDDVRPLLDDGTAILIHCELDTGLACVPDNGPPRKAMRSPGKRQRGMYAWKVTAKQRLLERAPHWTEEQAERALRAAEGDEALDEWGDLSNLHEATTAQTMQRLAERERAAGHKPW